MVKEGELKMTNTEDLIVKIFKLAFKNVLKKHLKIGQLATTEFVEGLSKGDETDITIKNLNQLFDYDGGELPTTEKLKHCRIKIDRGKAFHFELTAQEQKQILLNEPLIIDFTSSAINQFASAIDSAYSNLYTRAGHYLDNNGNAIKLTPEIAKDILAYMQAKFQRGDGKGHTNWVDGHMMCIIPPQYQYYLGNIENLCGWDIVVSSNIAQPQKDVFYPLFGVRNNTLAGAVSDLSMSAYTPENNFNICYKGYSLFGTAAANSDYLGTVKIQATIDSF